MRIFWIIYKQKSTLYRKGSYKGFLEHKMLNLLMSLDFWSALSGFIGSVMLFFFSLPPKLNPHGHINLILQQTDKKEAKKYRLFQKLSYSALALIAFSFFLQIVRLAIVSR